jgi:hypothetical protein
LKFYFRRVAVGLVATRFGRLIGHKPSRVELLVQLGFKACRMVVVLGHRMFRECVQRDRGREGYGIEMQSNSSHGLPPRRARGTPRLIIQLVFLQVSGKSSEPMQGPAIKSLVQRLPPKLRLQPQPRRSSRLADDSAQQEIDEAAGKLLLPRGDAANKMPAQLVVAN